jgi:ABC-type antimicrobial peptide transport system permease subunit
MSLLTNYRLARASLKAHRTRTLLTILGIIIGVFVISLVLIVGSGLSASVSRQVENLNDQLIVVKHDNSAVSGLEAFNPYYQPVMASLRPSHLTTITATRGVEIAAPMMFIGSRARSFEQTYDHITVVATNPDLVSVLGLRLESGAFIGRDDGQRNYVVLGAKLAEGLLATDQALGQQIELGGRAFTVIGILKLTNQPISLAGLDIDKAALVSLDSGQQLGDFELAFGQILVQADSSSRPDAVAKEVQKQLNSQDPAQASLSVETAPTAAKATASWVETITSAALIFAGISLLVGGIGVMNIMLVSVTERTREIGIRKAVGATRRKILTQFLFEALIMTLTGGLAGLALAYAAAYLVGLQFSLPLVVSWPILAICLGIPVAVGLLFGIWPAIRAARQDPIVALRQYH